MPPANPADAGAAHVDYASILFSALGNTLAVLLSLAAVLALTTLLFLLSKRYLIRFAHYIQTLTEQDPPDGSLNGVWTFGLVCVGGLVGGGYLGGLLACTQQGDALVAACARTVVVIAGIELGVGVCGAVIVGMGKVVGFVR